MLSMDIFPRKSALFPVVALGIMLCQGALPKGREAREQTNAENKKFGAVLVHVKLLPPLRPKARVRFSPDGKYLLIQDSAEIYVLSSDLVSQRLYLRAIRNYPGRFDAASQGLILLSRDLAYGRWHLPDGKMQEQRQLPIEDGCLDASLSPDGALLACYGPNFDLSLYRAATGERFSSFPLPSPESEYRIFMVPLDLHTVWANAFGYAFSNTRKPMVGRDLYHFPMFYSPDSAVLIAGDSSSSLRVDLTTRTKSKLPGIVEKHMYELAGLPQNDRALLVNRDRKSPSSLVSLSTGKVLASFSFSAHSARLATNPRYALLSDSHGMITAVFDLAENHHVTAPSASGPDVFSKVLAVYAESGELALYHIGEQSPFFRTQLPLGDLPILRCAVVSSSLDTIALADDGGGAIFDLATGRRTISTERFSAAFLDEPSSAVLVMPPPFDSPLEATRLDLRSGGVSVAWKGETQSPFRSGRRVILEYSFQRSLRPLWHLSGPPVVNYRLRSLDAPTGRELWHRDFLDDTPVPFADPQGDDFVLAWKAKSPGAAHAASRNPATRNTYKKAKLADRDTFFEICDSRTGKPRGGVLVQFGGEPGSFDAVFAAGDALFLIKDRVRVSVFSLNTGELITRLNGSLPVASPESNLFVLEDAPGRLAVFDLKSGRKMKELIFPDEIDYAHFSADGMHLLALTDRQEVFILDVRAMRASAPQRP